MGRLLPDQVSPPLPSPPNGTPLVSSSLFFLTPLSSILIPPSPLPQGYSIELSLLIVALADIGVLLALVATVVIRAWMANRAAEREATAAAAQVSLC